MKKADDLFGEIYRIDQDTDRYMIEIALDRYADIFSTWDPAPFKRRAMDPDLELYLEGSSDEISSRYPIELYFTLPAGSRNAAIEDETRYGLRNVFIFKIYLIKKELGKTNALILRYVLLGFIFLWIGTVSFKHPSDNVWLSLVADALIIGGWVFLWEAVSLFFFTNRELYQRYRTYRRLQNAPVIFREVDSQSPS
ncbi:MAG: hypothetical protein NW224_04695 [Leptolyngbyaceae cyanobacterium bins.302]|nr:hypothetical protein [Leptolyngbyaceae cyanobacterium bins.302]